jgi:hypothetical protein
MHRLVYLCDWLPPDFGAVGQYSLGFARARAAAGEAVTLVGLSSSGDSISDERVAGGTLRILRLGAAPYERSNFGARARWTLRTNLRLLGRAWSAMREADEILFTGSPPFLVHFLVPLNAVLGKRLTYRITDFHPECLIAELGRTPWPLAALRALTVALRRQVDAFQVLGEDQRRRLLDIGVPAERIVLLRDPSPVEFPIGLSPLALPPELVALARPGTDRPIVLLYSGNFGVAHEHRTVVDAYRQHHRAGSGRVVLWLNATGAKADLVEQELRAEGLPVYRSRPVPLGELPRLLVTPDAHLITLRDAFVGFVLPSKVYGCIASGRDVLFVGSAASDVDLLCRQGLPEGAYQRVAPGDAAGLSAALESLARRAPAPSPAEE